MPEFRQDSGAYCRLIADRLKVAAWRGKRENEKPRSAHLVFLLAADSLFPTKQMKVPAASIFEMRGTKGRTSE